MRNTRGVKMMNAKVRLYHQIGNTGGNLAHLRLALMI
ncbi:hypothetical protein VP137E351_P0069 [Vibrio phage 137E35-1]|nr:hypothetical protein VP137E351_P0069 [Vibrio phage 137E35-1]